MHKIISFYCIPSPSQRLNIEISLTQEVPDILCEHGLIFTVRTKRTGPTKAQMMSVCTFSQQWLSATYLLNDVARVTPTITTGSPESAGKTDNVEIWVFLRIIQLTSWGVSELLVAGSCGLETEAYSMSRPTSRVHLSVPCWRTSMIVIIW